MADDTVEAWARRAATLPAALVEATPGAVRASGTVLEAAVRASVAAATGGDMRLSNARSIKARRAGVGAGGEITLDVEVRGAGRTAKSVVVPKGPIMLVEEGSVAHRIPLKLRQLRRNVRTRARLNIPGIGWRTTVNHPGTKGKHPVRDAFDASHEAAGRAGVLEFAAATRRHLGGS